MLEGRAPHAAPAWQPCTAVRRWSTCEHACAQPRHMPAACQTLSHAGVLARLTRESRPAASMPVRAPPGNLLRLPGEPEARCVVLSSARTAASHALVTAGLKTLCGKQKRDPSLGHCGARQAEGVGLVEDVDHDGVLVHLAHADDAGEELLVVLQPQRGVRDDLRRSRRATSGSASTACSRGAGGLLKYPCACDPMKR